MITRLALAALLLAAPAYAQDFTDIKTFPNAITGTMSITFDTRTQTDERGAPLFGAKDTYTTDLTILDSMTFAGKIARTPWLPSTTTGMTAQEGSLTYDLRCILKNPANPAQTKTVGAMVGTVRLDGNGLYHLGEAQEGQGKLRIATDSIGKITGFVSQFSGTIQGRVPEQAGLWGMTSRASKRVTKTYQRYSSGQLVTRTVKGLDPMEFQKVDLAQGPLAGYLGSRLTGSIDYDAEQGIWYVDVTSTYSSEGEALRDRFSGTIRWNEDPNRAVNGAGWYDVNVRLNEKIASEQDAFLTSGSSEDAFFAEDSTVPGFAGKINYVDTFDGETVTASKVKYAVEGNQVSKVQTATFAKILLLMVGPFNDE